MATKSLTETPRWRTPEGRAYAKAYREANKEKRKAYDAARKAWLTPDGRAQSAARGRKYRKSHPERVAGGMAKWRAANAQHKKEYAVAWYAKNRDRILAERKTPEGRADGNRRSKEWYAKNADRLRGDPKSKARSAKYYAENKERLAEKSRAYRLANKERLAVKSAAYRAANKERIAQQNAKYRAANPGRDAAWRAANPEKRAAIRARRRARLLGAEGSHTAQEWRDKCAEYGGLCAYCGEPKKLTRDHVVPISKGGTDHIANIVPACASCNSKKRTKLPEHFTPPLAGVSGRGEH